MTSYKSLLKVVNFYKQTNQTSQTKTKYKKARSNKTDTANRISTNVSKERVNNSFKPQKVNYEFMHVADKVKKADGRDDNREMRYSLSPTLSLSRKNSL